MGEESRNEDRGPLVPPGFHPWWHTAHDRGPQPGERAPALLTRARCEAETRTLPVKSRIRQKGCLATRGAADRWHRNDVPGGIRRGTGDIRGCRRGPVGIAQGSRERLTLRRPCATLRRPCRQSACEASPEPVGPRAR